MTTNRFSVPLFWCCFLPLALNVFLFFSPASTPSRLFSLFYLREQWDMYLCCILLSLFWLSLCKIFLIYFLSCPIGIYWKQKKQKLWDNIKKVFDFWEGLAKSKIRNSKSYENVKPHINDPDFSKIEILFFCY